MPSPFFEAKALHVGYGNIKALHGIDVMIDRGEIVTLIGANGSGKSTFLKAVSGLLRPSSGGIFFEGERIDLLDAHKITQRGVVQIPEGRRIFPRLTVAENLDMGGFFRKDSTERAQDFDRVLDLFPVLKDRLKQWGGTLSGGEQQMLALARALMSRPKLLTLDEPSMGLAPLIVEKVFQIVKEINKEGVTILLVEQNARAALGLAQRGYVMETGAIMMEGSSTQLIANDQVKQCYLGIQESFI